MALYRYLWFGRGNPTLISSEKCGDIPEALARGFMRLRALSSENG
jgi:hypothetical protein